MSKWEIKKLGDFGEGHIGLTYTPTDVSDTGTIVLRSGNIQDRRLDFSDVVRVNKKINDRLIVREGDILICSRNGSSNLVGKSALITTLNEEMTFGAFMMTFKSEYNSFLIHFFQSNYFKRQLNQSATTTINQITKKMLDEIIVPLPPIEIQRQITNTLDITSELLAMLKQQLSELDSLIKSTFYDMFGDPVSNERGWGQCYINEVFDIVDGDRGVNYPKQDDFYDRGHCLFLNTGNVTKNGFNFDNVKFISLEKDNQLRKGKLVRDDIVLTTRGTVGNIAHYNFDVFYGDVRINSGMVLLRRIKNNISPSYFCELFKSDDMTNEVKAFLSGTAQPQLPITNLKKIKIVLPPIELQTQFATIVNKIEEQKALVKKAIDETQYLFDSLMSECFE